MKSKIRIIAILLACLMAVYALNVKQFGWHFGSILTVACVGTCSLTLALCRYVLDPWVEKGDDDAKDH